MPGHATAAERLDLVIEIGDVPIRLCVDDPKFIRLLETRYAGFVTPRREASFEFDIEIAPEALASPDQDVLLRWDSGCWRLDRSDFHAVWNPSSARGKIRQTANPYSIDSVLRIVHTILLAKKGGFLVHASSAVRNGRSFVFAGVSGSGKTTMARLAPPDAMLLTDEISYICRKGAEYCAFGTPFVGELARAGENLSAPIAAVYLLAKGAENRIEPLSQGEGVHALLQNILFFAKEREMVDLVFQAACDFVSRVPVHRLVFRPNADIWELVV